MEGSSDPAPQAHVVGSGAVARAPPRRRAPRSIDEARRSTARRLRGNRSGRADLRNGPDGRPRSPPRSSSVNAAPRCALRRPSAERARLVQGLESALPPTLRDSRSGRADLRDGQHGRHRSPPRPSSVPAPPRCALRRPSVERAPVVQGLRELTLEREHAKAMIVWPVGRARQAVRSGAVQGSYVVPPGGRAAHPVLWRSSPHRCAASAVR